MTDPTLDQVLDDFHQAMGLVRALQAQLDEARETGAARERVLLAERHRFQLERTALREAIDRLTDVVTDQVARDHYTLVCDRLAEVEAERDALQAQIARTDQDTLEIFVAHVNARAEAAILAGAPIEGAHHRAILAEVAFVRATPGSYWQG